MSNFGGFGVGDEQLDIRWSIGFWSSLEVLCVGCLE